ncbi:hypothetical protein NA78x_006218 [Anatilimnocola sp. NA78]|uniref:hypothetical protein n=1 Tax=Anatilimnocola sp. NA78 TaxID=3415683 RepID=UPI003CE56EC0
MPETVRQQAGFLDKKDSVEAGAAIANVANNGLQPANSSLPQRVQKLQGMENGIENRVEQFLAKMAPEAVRQPAGFLDKSDSVEAGASAELGLPEQAPLVKGGRPTVMTAAMVERLFLLLSVGFSRRQAAEYLKIAPTTITNLAKRDEDLAAELLRAEELGRLQPELTLMAKARRNWRAAAWYMKFKLKNPTPLSEEEQEERHQAELAVLRRKAELKRAKRRAK